MPAAWYRFLYRVIVRAYYRRVRAVGLHETPDRPTLYVGLHRNGAVDGMVYKALVPRATFMISEQLTRSTFGQLFFTGIPVAREKDVAGEEGAGRRRANLDSLALCVDHLTHGGALFILPEGTSDLGPRHLPFKSGVAQILVRAVDAGAPVRVVPVGIFYQRPEAFRSDVTVVFGEDIPTADLGDDERRRPRELMNRITAALEAIGVNVESAATLYRVETMASLAVEKPGLSYHQRLKALESAEVPPAVGDAWRRLLDGMSAGRVATSLEAPAFSQRGPIWNGAWLLVQTPFVLAGFLANLPILLGAWAAGRRFADARNTIALWRVLIGAPIAVVWILAIAITALVTRTPLFVTAWFWATVYGVSLYPELRDRWPRFRNSFGKGEARADVQRIRSWVVSLVVASRG